MSNQPFKLAILTDEVSQELDAVIAYLQVLGTHRK